MTKIKLSNINKYIIVDDEDYSKVIRYSWSLNGGNNAIVGTVNNKSINLGKFIFGDKNTYTDHKDGNIFNNQKFNLRKCTQQQNMFNRCIPTTNNSGYKGVCWKVKNNKWVANIRAKGMQLHLGLFTSKEEAAKAYNIAAIKYFGEFARLNIIKEDKNVSAN